MIIYAATKRDFVGRAENATIADDIENLVREKLHRETPKQEKESWRNSLSRIGVLLSDNVVPDDAGVAIEYTIPMSSKRIDVLVSGVDDKGVSQVVIIELKQWDKLSAVDGQDGIVETYVGGRVGPHPHPSYQALSYAQLMRNTSAVVQDRDVDIWPCAYLHNYVRKREGDPLDAVQYHRYLSESPAFTYADEPKLKDFISRYVKKGDSARILYEIENGEIRPSKSLQDALASMLKGNPEFVMIDSQKVVYESILYSARMAKHRQKKEVLIVQGGPGTGKSVVAINALVRLIGDGQIVHYVTKNSAPRNVFFERLRGKHTQTYIKNLFRGSGCYVDAIANEFGTILVDEAHRLNEKSGMYHNLGENQIKEIINASWCSVFFIDEHQQVTTYDAGSVAEIRKFARAAGAELKEYKLNSQFRCNGSDGYLSWLDSLLYDEESAITDLSNVDYEFKVVDSPEELRRVIESRNTSGINARIVAGYCWKWISEGKNDSSIHDIEIGDFGISWNLGNSPTWAIDASSVKEAGCIHTCQGLEFEHVGVIIGEDMFIKDGKVCTDFTKRASTDQSIKGLKGMLKKSPTKAKEIGDKIVRNTYRTLMTRGSKSCIIYCCDRSLSEYIKQRVGQVETKELEVVDNVFRVEDNVPQHLQWIEFLPYYDVKAACGYFGDGELAARVGWVKVTGKGKLNRNMFVVRASGRSMEPRIHDGDLCVFQANPAGSRQGRIVLVQHRQAYDPDYGCACSIKEYSSRKSYSEDGEWRHEEIVLKPLNHEYNPIVITENDDDQLRVVAELVGIVK